MDPLVSTEWLANQLETNVETIAVIDASWRMPGAPPARDDYDQRHIPGAQFFDIDAIAQDRTDLPHMLPSPAAFGAAVGAMGVGNQHAVIVYDDQGLFSAPRVWWTFRAMGHADVAVLDGGLKKWIAEKRPLSNSAARPQPAEYIATPEKRLLAAADDVRAAIDSGGRQIIDARPAARFQAAAPEPRAELLSGAMPGALNAPFSEFVNEDGTMKSAAAIASILGEAGVALEKPAIATCGSGVTAAVIALALARLGRANWSLYDGSWAEWGKETNDRVAYPVIR